MLQHLKALFGTPEEAKAPRPHSFEERQLAAAALMVEAAQLDADFDADERQRIATLLETRFQLAPRDAEALLAEAEQAADASVEWHGFTRALKDGFDHEERIQLIEMLWEVAYADGTLHDYEASLLRRVAGLLYVPDRESGEARKRVLTRLGLDSP